MCIIADLAMRLKDLYGFYVDLRWERMKAPRPQEGAFIKGSGACYG